MASIETGKLYTDAQVAQMPAEKKEALKIVGITPEEEKLLSGMNRKGRRAWLKQNKK